MRIRQRVAHLATRGGRLRRGEQRRGRLPSERRGAPPALPQLSRRAHQRRDGRVQGRRGAFVPARTRDASAGGAARRVRRRRVREGISARALRLRSALRSRKKPRARTGAPPCVCALRLGAQEAVCKPQWAIFLFPGPWRRTHHSRHVQRRLQRRQPVLLQLCISDQRHREPALRRALPQSRECAAQARVTRLQVVHMLQLCATAVRR